MSTEPVYDHPDVVLCPGGPMLLRGVRQVRDAEGVDWWTATGETAA